MVAHLPALGRLRQNTELMAAWAHRKTPWTQQQEKNNMIHDNPPKIF